MTGRPFEFPMPHGPDIGAIVELEIRHGMAFDDQGSREAFFARIERQPRSVMYGAALAHATSTSLGIGGGDDALFSDCARIFAAELIRYVLEHPEEAKKLENATRQIEGVKAITPEMVKRSTSFWDAYRAAREPKEAAISNFVRSFGNNSSHMAHQDQSGQRLNEDVIENVYQRTLNDIVRAYGRSRE